MKKLLKVVKKHPVCVIFSVLTLAVMCIIFSFSAENGEKSSTTSSGFCYFLATVFVPKFSTMSDAERAVKIAALVPVIRKLAHFSVFCALGFCSSMAFFSKGGESPRRARLLRAAAAAMFCLVYAASDELHQLFVSGRSCALLDVLIDFSGSLLGILVSALIFALALKILKNRKKYRQ